MFKFLNNCSTAVSKSFANTFSAITTIGRSGMIFLGTSAALTSIAGFTEPYNLAISGILTGGVFISYGSIFTDKLNLLFSKVYDSAETLRENLVQDKLSSGKKFIKTLGKFLGCLFGGTTALVEGVVTCVGWATWLHTFGVHAALTYGIGGVVGAASVVGWIALVGMPTYRVFNHFADLINNTHNGQGLFESITVFPLISGLLIALTSAIGSGSIGFYALNELASHAGFLNNTLVLQGILAFGVFVGTGSLYVTAIPKAFQSLVKPCSSGTNNTANEKPQSESGICDYLRLSPGMVSTLYTGGATYLLGYTGTGKIITALAHTLPHPEIAKHVIGACLGIGAMSISGQAGMNFLKSPSQFFKQINNYYPKPAVVINEESSLVINRPR